MVDRRLAQCQIYFSAAVRGGPVKHRKLFWTICNRLEVEGAHVSSKHVVAPTKNLQNRVFAERCPFDLANPDPELLEQIRAGKQALRLSDLELWKAFVTRTTDIAWVRNCTHFVCVTGSSMGVGMEIQACLSRPDVPPMLLLALESEVDQLSRMVLGINGFLYPQLSIMPYTPQNVEDIIREFLLPTR